MQPGFAVPEPILGAYDLDGAEVELLTGGRTNRTLRVRAGRDLVLQQMMHGGHDDLLGIMENLVRVTSHLSWRARAAGDPDDWFPRLVPTIDGRPFVMNDAGDVWRAFAYRPGQIVRAAQPRRTLASAARLYGRFAAATFDLGEPDLIDTAPGFHDLDVVYAQLMTDLANAAPGRADPVALHVDRIERVRSRVEGLSLDDGLGTVRRRVVHNDTKLSNVLFDGDRGEAIAVLDLDLVMMGPCWHDVGDLVRSVAWHDGAEPRSPSFGVGLFTTVVEAYAAGASPTLTPAEVATFAIAGPRLSLELAMRYLNDHLRDEPHLRVDGIDGHLRRGEGNLWLAEVMLGAYDSLRRAVDALAATVDRGGTDGGWPAAATTTKEPDEVDPLREG